MTQNAVIIDGVFFMFASIKNTYRINPISKSHIL